MFPERLKSLRIEKGLTQLELADIVELSLRGYRKFENGDNLPNMRNLVALADFFDVSVDYLIGRDDVPNRKDSIQ